MKKLWLLVLAAMLAALCLHPAAAPLSDGLYFVAYNDSVPLHLDSGTAPFYQNGTLYAVQGVFAVSGMGVTPTYNPSNQTVVLFSRSQRLVFHLDTGRVTDENDQIHGVGAKVRGGTIYLPVAMCAGHFGMSVSYLTNNKGYQILRFTSGEEVYDDSLFLQKSENLIDYHVQQYQKEQTAKPETPPAKPDQSAPPQEPEKKAPTVYLAVENAASMDASLAAMRKSNVQGTFFLTEEEIRTHPELVQRLFAEGRSVGLTVSPQEAQPQAALAAANDALRALVGQKTLLALLTAAQKKQVEGYCAMTRERSVDSKTAAEKDGGVCLVLLRGNADEALRTLREAKVKYRPLRETSPF